MEDHKEGNGWMSVPAFGDWDHKGGAVPNYSMDFSKIRKMRKENKTDFSRASIGNDKELIPHRGGGGKVHRDAGDEVDEHHSPHHRHHSSTRKKILRYFNCCMIGA